MAEREAPASGEEAGQKRRNVRTALFLFVVAASFYVGFLWSVSHRH